MRIRRTIGIARLCIAALLIVRLSTSFYRFHAVARDFDSVHEGDTREAVRDRLGEPNYHPGACLEDLHVVEGCVSEVVYSHPFAPWLPEYYVVDFNAQGRVIATA